MAERVVNKPRFSLAELFIWVAFCGVIIAWSLPYFRDLGGIREFYRAEAMAVSADGSTAAVADFNGRVRLWNLHRRAMFRALHLGPHKIVEMALSSDGALLATLRWSFGRCAGGDCIEVWDVHSGERVDLFTPDRHAKFCFSPTAPQLVSIVDYRIELRSYGDETIASQRQIELSIERPSSLTFSPDGRTLAVGGSDRIALLNADSFEQKSDFETCAGVYRRLAVSPDGRSLLAHHTAFDVDRRGHAALQIWNTASGQMEGVLGEAGGINYSSVAAYLPNGRILLANDGLLRLLDSESLSVQGERIDYEEQVQFIAAPCRGTTFLVGGCDSVAAWDATALSPKWTLWNSTSAISRNKQKVWGNLLFPLVEFSLFYLARQVRKRNHHCQACGQHFLPETVEDWGLGCASCRAGGRISEKRIAQVRRSQRLIFHLAIFSTIAMAIVLAAIGYFCWLKVPAVPLFSPVGSSLVMMASGIGCTWLQFLLQPRSANSAASDEALMSKANTAQWP